MCLSAPWHLTGWPRLVSDEQQPAVIEVEVEIGGAHGVFLLPMGIGWEDRCIGAGQSTEGVQGTMNLSDFG